MDYANRRRVVVESPYAGDAATVERNETYARQALRDCIFRGEAPFASHLLYTQPGVLVDGVKWERDLGIECGFAWGAIADAVVVYGDLGITEGMQRGIKYYVSLGLVIEYRTLPGWQTSVEPNTENPGAIWEFAKPLVPGQLVLPSDENRQSAPTWGPWGPDGRQGN